jgi:hypothetical protein
MISGENFLCLCLHLLANFERVSNCFTMGDSYEYNAFANHTRAIYHVG